MCNFKTELFAEIVKGTVIQIKTALITHVFQKYPHTFAFHTKIPVFVICTEAIICLLLYILHDCTFKHRKQGAISQGAKHL